MDNNGNQVWENIKKYAKVFFQGVGLVFAYLFHYIGVFCVFVYKKAKVLFKRLVKLTRKHIRRVKKHIKAGDYSLLIYTILAVVIVIVLLILLIHGIASKGKTKSTTTETVTETVTTTEAVDQQTLLREQAASVYQSDQTYLMLVNDANPITDGYTFEHHQLHSGYIVDERIYSDLLAMLEACNAAGYEYTIKGGYVSADTEGSGEYATGLAFDVTAHDIAELDATVVATLGTNQWLMQNCSSYGFIVRYPEGKESITGHSYEPWHFRYVGRDAAAFMTANNLTLEEFYTLLNGGSVELSTGTDGASAADSGATTEDPDAAAVTEVTTEETTENPLSSLME